MILETSHASASLDVKGAQESYDKLQLVDYPGENSSALASAALKYLNIINTYYAMNVKTDSKLLTKGSKTSSDYFNRNMHDKMSDTRELEPKYAFKDPKLLKADSEYPTLGPFGLCGFI